MGLIDQVLEGVNGFAYFADPAENLLSFLVIVPESGLTCFLLQRRNFLVKAIYVKETSLFRRVSARYTRQWTGGLQSWHTPPNAGGFGLITTF